LIEIKNEQTLTEKRILNLITWIRYASGIVAGDLTKTLEVIMLQYSHEGRVAVWTLSRPPVNAINDEWLSNFHKALDEIESKNGVSILHIRSNQKVFCAGADLKLMRSCFEKIDGPTEMVAMVRRMQALYKRIENLSQVSIVELGGTALAGGLELALACDFRIAANEAKLGLTEINLGLLPAAGGTQRLSKLCGSAIARRLILGGEMINGVTAETLGLVHWSVPHEQLQDRVGELLEKWAGLTVMALAKAKRCLLDYDLPDVDGFETELSGTLNLYEDPETRKLVETFLRKD
jgi:enoyl-CoA hydratase